MTIIHIPHNSIDTVRWDKCIEQAINGCIFAYSWYLSHSCQEWSALVNEDYSIVMPLPYSLFLGVKTLQNPAFSPFLGIFSSKPFNQSVILNFISAIPKDFRHLNLILNKLNIDKNDSLSYFNNYEKAFELDIIRSYPILQKNYDSELKNKLINAEKTKVNIVSGIQLIDLLQLHMNNSDLSSLSLTDNKVKQLRNIGLNCLRNSSGELIGAYDNKNTLCATALIVSSHNKAHLVFYAQNKFAIKNNVLEQIIDFFIRKHSEKNITLSVFNNINKHINFGTFGSTSVKYPELLINRLPIHLKPFKNLILH